MYLSSLAIADEKTLDIDPVYQDLPEWCWVASGEMVLKYSNEPNVNPAGIYQCGIIGLFFGPMTSCWYNCATCNVPAYSTGVLKRMLSGYPQAAAAALHRLPAMPIRFREAAALSFDDLKNEIDNDRPVLSGINPSGGFRLPYTAQHATVIVGYDDEGDDQFIVVNDPFPYEAFGVRLYQSLGGQELERGQYKVNYRAFRNRLGWSLSLYGIVDPN
jgi:hypothetical protein